MKNPDQGKSVSSIASTIIPPQEQYKNFIETVVTQAQFYALYHDGWVLCSTPSSQQALAVWQTQSRAHLLIRDKWADYQVEEVGLIPFVEKSSPLYVNKTRSYRLISCQKGRMYWCRGVNF